MSDVIADGHDAISIASNESDNENIYYNVQNEYLPSQQNLNYNYNQLKLLKSINEAYNNSLTDLSPRAETPKAIKIPLKPHQAALLHAMNNLEYNLRDGYDAPDKSKLYSRYAILGDAVGAGKSLTVLSHIASMKQKKLPNPAYYHKHSTPYMYSTWNAPHQETNKATLIIIPHSLYRQWVNYITAQTTLKIAQCKSRTFLNDEADAKKKILESDAVLVSNTMYNSLQSFATGQNIQWERIFIDEVDNIHITRNSYQLHADFVWFISATWIPFVAANTIYITTNTLDYYISNGDINLDKMHDDFKENFLQQKLYYNLRSTYLIDTRWQSMVFFNAFINQHPNRYLLVLRATDAFRKQSLELPAIKTDLLLCKGVAQHRIVESILSNQISEMLHAGDISGALEQLGVEESSPMSLIEAVTMNQHKELHRLEATLEFKKTLEYSTPALKESALESLQIKIKSLKDQISSLQKRIEGVDNETCAICYETVSAPTCVPCCKHFFCGGCILEALKRNTACPFCRAKISVQELKVITKKEGRGRSKKTDESNELLRKPEALLKLIKDNPTGRFIVFSRYENPFASIEALLTENSIHVAQVKGNKDVIHSLLDKFKKNEIRVLLLNSEHFATGMNLEAASHVVLYHGNMTPNERQQIIGRAQRLGRSDSLNVVQMLHEYEK
jgi:hypothetical protein